jgi:hypothetical protein
MTPTGPARRDLHAGQRRAGSPCTGIVVYFRIDDIDDARALR